MLETIITIIHYLPELDPVTAITLTSLGVVGYALHVVSIALRNKKDE